MLLQQTYRRIKAVPEVECVFGKAGRADTATDPVPLEMFEMTIRFKPKSEWCAGMPQEKLIDELDRVAREIEGVAKTLPGISSAPAERLTGGRYIDVSINRAAAARYGMNVVDVQAMVSGAIVGEVVGQRVEAFRAI